MQRDAGTIFLDTMIAAAIVAVSLAMLYSTIADSVKRDGAAQDRAMATLVAQSELAAVGYEIPLDARSAAGVMSPYVWRIAMTPWSGGGTQMGASRLWLVTVTVGRDGRDVVSLNTLRLAPSP